MNINRVRESYESMGRSSHCVRTMRGNIRDKNSSKFFDGSNKKKNKIKPFMLKSKTESREHFFRNTAVCNHRNDGSIKFADIESSLEVNDREKSVFRAVTRAH